MAAIIEFEGRGEQLIATLKEATDATIKLKDESSKAGEAVKKSAIEGTAAEQKLAVTIDATATALQAVRKEAEKGGTGKLAADTTAAAKATADYAASNEKAASAVARSRQEAALLIANTKSLTAAEKEAAAAAGGITKEFKAIVASGKGMEKSPALASEAAKSLRTQLREAKAELDRIVEASDGKITPELIAAGRRAGELQDRFGDLTGTIDAFNPDTKFKSVIGIFGNLTGGIQAASSAMGLFGGESEDVNKALLKVQQASAFFQGLQSFIGGLADNWKNLRAVIAASAVATQADTAAKGANAVGTAAVATANTAAATSTGVLTGAFNALKAALLTNPITAIAVALLALGAAIYSVMSDTRDYTAALDDLIKRLDDVSKSRFNELDQRLRLDGIKNEREALEAGETDAAKRRQKEKDYIAERSALVGKQLEREANMIALITELESLRGKDSDSANQARETAISKLREYSEEFKQGTVDLKVLEEEQTNNTIRGANERKKANEESSRARVKSAEAAANEIAKLEADLKRRADASVLADADPRQKLELQRAAAIEEVRILERTLQEKIALQRIEQEVGAETFAKLSEAQKKARTDAMIDGGQVELAVAQQEKITSLELAEWAKYWEARKALDLEQRAALLELQAEGFEKDRAVFDVELEKRVEALRAKGATIIQLEAFIQSERDKFRSGQVQKAIGEEEALALAQIEAQQRGAESEKAFRFRIEIEKLAAQEGFAQQRLAALEGDTSAEAELIRAQLQGTINSIKAQRAELVENAPNLDLFDLLGINITEGQKAQLISDLKSIGQSVLDFATAGVDAKRAALDAEAELNDERISEQQRLREELQAQLDQALADDKEGRANNADAIRAQIELTKTVEAEALNEKKRIQAEQQKLAKQQILIDSAVQVSALITANARLFEKGALAGLPGIISAIAASLSLIATFAAIKAKIKASAGGTPSFKKGGMLQGPSHEQGGVALLDRRTGQHFAEAEGGEFVVNRKSSKKFRHTLDALNEGDMHKAQEAAIKELLGNTIQLDGDRITKIVRMKEEYIQNTTVVNKTENDGLRKDMKRLTGIVEAFMEQEGTRETTTGNVTKKPGKTVRIRG